MRATSLRRTVAPSFSTFRMTDSKSATVVSWLCAVTVTLSCWPLTAGTAPSEPTETWVFWLSMALVTSAVVSWYLLSLNGSSQIRIAYSEPNTLMLPTPSRRLIWSSTREENTSPRSAELRLPSVEISAPTIRILDVERLTWIPRCCTVSGNCDWTSCSLFCT
ncbi:hypothetical protein D3C86_1033560 [compost metagenome]